MLHALQVRADLARLAAELLLLLFRTGGVGPLLEVHRLLVEPAHAVDRLVDAVDQALALGVGEPQFADDPRDHDLLAAQRPAAAAIVARPLLLRNFGQLLEKLNRLFIVALQFVDPASDVLQAIDYDFFGDLFLVEEDDFLDGTDAPLQIFADGDDLANHDGRTRERFQHA